MSLRDHYKLVHEEVASEGEARHLVTSLNKRASKYIKECKPARYVIRESTDEEGNVVKKYIVWYWI